MTSWVAPRPLWRNAKFQLLAIESVRDLLIIGRGWYRTESQPKSAEQEQHEFRWLRSYGELILLNSSGEDMRLRLTIVSGSGLPTPDRSISVALNGERFDEIETSGVANVITKAFHAQGFMNRLSLSLPDTAQPLARKWGLFRLWVPKDGRRLNAAVSKIELLTERQYKAIKMPCSVDLSRADAWNVASLNGIYADRWVAGEAHVSLDPCGDADAISIQGFVPDLSGSNPPFPITVSLDGARQTIGLSKPGPFTIEIPLLRTLDKGGRHDVLIGSPRTFVPAPLGLGPDRRRLSLANIRAEGCAEAARFAHSPSPSAGLTKGIYTATTSPPF